MRLRRLSILLAFLFPVAILTDTWEPGDECPDTIKTTVPGGWGSEGRFPTMASVHSALTTCPNITALDLRAAHLGCTESPDRWNLPFDQAGGEQYPPLKELRLEGYFFEDSEWHNSLYKNFHTDQPGAWQRPLDWIFLGHALDYWQYSYLELVQRTKTNIDLWLDAMDWSKLESLGWKYDGYGKADKFPSAILPRLTSLKKLEIEYEDGTDTMEILLGLEDHSLTHLTHVGRPLPPIPLILEHQGRSLEVLEVHAPELMCDPSPFYNDTDIALLSQSAPRLSHLALNVYRNGTWPWETLELLSFIPSLRSLDLWLEITAPCRRQKRAWYDDCCICQPAGPTFSREVNDTCAGEEQYQKPIINATSALEVYKYLRGNKVGEELGRVAFWVGDWSRGWDGGLRAGEPWIEGRRAKVVCDSQDKVEGEGWCLTESGERYWQGRDWDDW